MNFNIGGYSFFSLRSYVYVFVIVRQMEIVWYVLIYQELEFQWIYYSIYFFLYLESLVGLFYFLRV